MSEPTGKKMRAWLRRAETIKRKAEDLMNEVVDVTGVEHPLTDYVDNVVHMSEELVDAMGTGRWAKGHSQDPRLTPINRAKARKE